MTAGIAADPFVRGCAWPGTDEFPYPRADPSDLDRLPGDTVAAARLPVGVRLELVGDADVLELDYETRTDDLGYRGDGAGRSFTVVCRDEVVADAVARLGPGIARLDLSDIERDSADPVLVYLPEGMKPIVRTVRAFGGTIEPAPVQPRWLAYGDSITEGWVASEPVHAWPAVAGRRFGLDVVNIGYAGSARGETVSAEHLAALDASVISLSHGTNCWSRIPFSVDGFREQTRTFLSIVRQGHPDTPIVVTSPILRPDAETTPNRLGATLADLRVVMEDVTRERIARGDHALTLVEGGGLVEPGDLPDGIHPGDDAHQVLAEVFGAAVDGAATR